MTKEELSALLGRPLTPIEDANFESYLNIAYELLDDLICTPIVEVEETRTFDLREGYSTTFIDIFWDVLEVKVNDKVKTNYSPRQWNKRNASWYNSLVFTDKFSSCDTEIEVTASWGFSPTSGGSSIPLDLQSVISALFALITKKNKYDPTVASKQNRDYRISFHKDTDLDSEFYKNYGSTIDKYSLCNIPNVQHGEVSCGC